MDKTKELIDKLNEHPDRKLIFMYPEEGSDYPYTLGFPKNILIDEYVSINEYVWLKEHDIDELFDHIVDNVVDEVFPNLKELSEEQEKIIDEKTFQKIDGLDWKKAIVVYIGY